jgi:hypothetical protein
VRLDKNTRFLAVIGNWVEGVDYEESAGGLLLFDVNPVVVLLLIMMIGLVFFCLSVLAGNQNVC